MTIKGYDGSRMTPKQKAQELVWSAATTVMDSFSDERYGDAQYMSDREAAEVERQLVMVLNRVGRLLGGYGV